MIVFLLFLFYTDNENDLTTGAVVAISIVITFIITLVVTALITIIITRICYKHQQHKQLKDRANTDTVFENNHNQNDCQVENLVYGSRDELQTNPCYVTVNKIVKKQ